MPLKTVVKVSNISNLGEARYCAGMGVDMLGFRVVSGHPRHMPPGLFQEIRGWIAGPKIVAEIYGLRSADDIASAMANYRPDYFELSDAEYLTWRANITVPCLVNVAEKKPDSLALSSGERGYLLIDENALHQIAEKKETQPILVKVTSPDRVSYILEKYQVAGIVLSATEDHNTLSDILEVLDES